MNSAAFWVLVFILLNAYFVICEIILVSVRKTKIAEWAKKGRRRARLVIYALNHLKIFLGTTQVGITLISIALGLIGSPWLEKSLIFLIRQVSPGFVNTLFISRALTLISFLSITYIELVFGELLPKTLALRKPENYSLYFIPPLYIFAGIFWPLTALANISTYAIIGLAGIKKIFTDRPYSEEEIKMILSNSGKTGQITTIEMEMAYNVFKLKKLRITDLMIPEKKLVAFEENLTINKIEDKIAGRKTIYNRYPIYRKTINRIIGFVHVTDLFKDNPKTVRALPLSKTPYIRKILQIEKNEHPDKVFVKMQKNGIRAAVVVDRNRTLGIVSLTDIIDRVVKNETRKK